MNGDLRESFLRQLMILQSPSAILSADTTSHNSNPLVDQQKKQKREQIEQEQQANVNLRESPSSSSSSTNDHSLIEPTQQQQQHTASSTAPPHPKLSADEQTKKKEQLRQVDITLLDESGSTGRTLSAQFVACDTNLTHILLNDLKTPIGLQPSALMRLNDVIAITYR